MPSLRGGYIKKNLCQYLSYKFIGKVTKFQQKKIDGSKAAEKKPQGGGGGQF